MNRETALIIFSAFIVFRCYSLSQIPGQLPYQIWSIVVFIALAIVSIVMLITKRLAKEYGGILFGIFTLDSLARLTSQRELLFLEGILALLLCVIAFTRRLRKPKLE
jgi:hypothetical protein